MKSVRLFYKKGGVMRFCSHLDVTRYMTRLIRKAALPIWHTEGFNPRPYITFALPLPLGFLSEYEIMDIRLTDDEYDISDLPEKLNAFCREGITFFMAREPVKKTGLLTCADYAVSFDDGGEVKDRLEDFLKREKITVNKKTKRGTEKEIDIKEHLKNAVITGDKSGNTRFCFTLPAGGSLNINPELLLGAFCEDNDLPYTVTRTALKDENGEFFA